MAEVIAPAAPAPAPASTPAPTQTAMPPPITKESVATAAEKLANPTPQAKVTTPGQAPVAPVEPTKSTTPPSDYKPVTVDPGYEKVNFGKFGPEIQSEFEPRFNRLYKQLKASDRKNQQNDARYDALMSEFQNYRTQQAKDIHNYNVQTLTAYMDQAIQAGNVEQARQYRDQLLKMAQEGAQAPADIKISGPAALSDQETNYVKEWSKARPWGDPKHPYHGVAKAMAIEIGNHPNFSNHGVDEILEQVDKQMGMLTGNQRQVPQQVRPVPQQSQAPAVLTNNSNLRQAPQPQEADLSYEQKRTAENLQPNMPQKLAHDWYKKALRKSNGIDAP